MRLENDTSHDGWSDFSARNRTPSVMQLLSKKAKMAFFDSLQRAAGISLPPSKFMLGVRIYFMLFHRKVTIWARVQSALGLKVVAEVPAVIPFSTAHTTGLL